MTENETEFKKEELQNLLKKKRDNLKEIEQIGKNSNYILSGNILITQFVMLEISNLF